MFCQSLEITLNLAYTQAYQKGHAFMTIEHLLVALLENTEVIEIMQACKIDANHLRKELYMFLDSHSKKNKRNSVKETQPSLGFQRVLQRSIIQAQSSSQQEVNGYNVLTSILTEDDSFAFELLNKQGLSRIDIINFLVHKNNYSPPSAHERNYRNLGIIEQDIETETDIPQPESSIERYTININQAVRQNKTDPLIGRSKELQRTMQILCRRSKNNPLLVGEPGVGKTAIAEGLARAIVEHNVPPLLQYTTIYSLDLGMLLAGTKYRGDFEKRFKTVLNDLKQRNHCILFIDEMHTLIGAGAASGGALDAANLIKPLLTTGELKCIGATTYSEYRNLTNKDKALSRRFQKIDIKEPSVKDTISILQGLKPKLEKHHNIVFSQSAIESAATLSKHYLHDRFLPDKAIDLIDEAGARENLKPAKKRAHTVNKKHILEILSSVAQIPKAQISSQETKNLISLDQNLKRKIFGQNTAIEQLCSSIRLARSGLNNKNKPIGSFLLAGPTGVGKTELCIQLSKELGLKLIRLDMSEYMEKHSASQIIGAPPGYVGFENGGQLTKQITKHPHSIILLDEFEKAHSDIHNLLLQIMDYGFMTDNFGNEIDFRHAVIIMTCNVGGQEMNKNDMGFTKQNNKSDGLMAINKSFTPEFRNRLDGILMFNALNETHILSVVQKFMDELKTQLSEKKMSFEITQKAIEWLAKKGFDPKMGARPMERVIRKYVKEPLANKIIFDKLHRGTRLKIGLKGKKIDIKSAA